MPIHDWTRVDAGLFHAFHQRWISALSDALNSGGLPAEYFALAEQNIRGPIPDVLTLKLATTPGSAPEAGTTAVLTAQPCGRVVRRSESSRYADKANRITIPHRHGDVVAVIEIVSPGTKGGEADFHAFIQKSVALLHQGIHLLLIDLFPPSRRDPHGVAQALWNKFEDDDLELPPDKPLTVMAFDAGPTRVAYVEPVAVGDPLPEMPLFLRPEAYVLAPLEATYHTAWSVFPAVLQRLLDAPAARL